MSSDIVVEVGPGTGNLTRILAARAGTVIAVEKDHRLITDLQKEFASAHIKIVEGDVLDLDPASLDLREDDYKIVANLPYYITSHFLRTLFEKWPRPKSIVLTIQKEVAQRIIAEPPHMNLLALSVQYYAEPKIVAMVSRGSFRPMPNVDSSVIRLIPKRDMSEPEFAEKFFAIAKTAFAGKRKQLRNTLSGYSSREQIASHLAVLGRPETARPEMLSLPQWLMLVRLMSKM